MILTLITWLRQFLSDFCSEKLLSPYTPFPYCTLWKVVTSYSTNLRGGKLCSTSLSAKYPSKLFRIILYRRCVYSSYLFTYIFYHLLLSVWTHEYLFYNLDNKPILLYFAAQMILVIKSIFSWLLCSFEILSWFCFLSTSLLSSIIKFSMPICTFHVIVPESARSLRRSGSFHWEWHKKHIFKHWENFVIFKIKSKYFIDWGCFDYSLCVFKDI